MAYSVGEKYLIFISVLISVLYVRAVEEIIVTHAPDSVKFDSSEPIRSSYVGEIVSAILAYTVKSTIQWHSLTAVSPWNRPEGVVVLELSGFSNKVDLPIQGNKFLLENVGDLGNQYDLPAHRTEERYFGKSNVMLHMHMSDELHESKISQPLLLKSLPADPDKRLSLALADPELNDLIKMSIFNASDPCHAKLLTELATVKEFSKALLARKAEIHDKCPDIYWLKLAGLGCITAEHSPDSLQVKEALRLLRQMLAEVERTMRNIYEDNVVVMAVKTFDDLQSTSGHRGRRLLETTEVPVKENDYNLAPKWDPIFPVTFAIMVFIGITLVLSVLAITVALWNMDPGRDSIIYRMTSQRMKKD